jgi:hypothetical protein
MPVIQTFDTFLADTETGASLLIESLPARSLAEEFSEPERDVEEIAEALGFETVATVQLPGSALPKILASMIAAPELFQEFGRESFEAWWQSTIDKEPALASFVEEVSYAPLVPTERSPVDTQSLAEFALTSTVVLGVLHGNPVLIVSGLVGIVVVRVVNGLAKGAEKAFEEEGYHWTHRLLRRLRGSTR